jgi:hypothetical protein
VPAAQTRLAASVRYAPQNEAARERGERDRDQAASQHAFHVHRSPLSMSDRCVQRRCDAVSEAILRHPAAAAMT